MVIYIELRLPLWLTIHYLLVIFIVSVSLSDTVSSGVVNTVVTDRVCEAHPVLGSSVLVIISLLAVCLQLLSLACDHMAK